MKLMIQNKTFVPQLVWMSSPDQLTEEVLVLKSRETRCLSCQNALGDVTVWDRSSEYRLNDTDRKRRVNYFGIFVVDEMG